MFSPIASSSKGCTLCSGSLTHYGVTMGDHVVLDVNAYLMKGEIMDPTPPGAESGERRSATACSAAPSRRNRAEEFVPAKVRIAISKSE